MWSDFLNQSPLVTATKKAMNLCGVKDKILKNNNTKIVIPDNDMTQAQILKSWDDRQSAGHPGQATWFLRVKLRFMWVSITAYLHRYIDIVDYV